MGRAALIGAALLAIVSPQPLAAQVQTPAPTPTPTPSPTPAAEPSDDIVVTDLRDINDPKSPVTRATLGSSRVGNSVASRTAFELAERFARCAVSPALRGAEELRGALDDTINSARQVFNQKRFVQLNSSCALDATIARQTGIAAAGPYYDRGALFLQAIKVFAPDLRLTKEQTADPAVQARFNTREAKLTRFRLYADQQYFETAICLVRLQPELSVRLLHVTDYPSVGRVEAAIVNGARACTGNARKVYFDASQFRLYIADAVYRWAVAAGGIDSLIPVAG